MSCDRFMLFMKIVCFDDKNKQRYVNLMTSWPLSVNFLTSSVDAFELFVTNEMLDQIMTHTNEEGRQAYRVWDKEQE